MLKLNCKNSDYRIIGDEHGLNLDEEFNNYSERIADIIRSLNQRKDKPNEWLQWMNLGYNEETVWYVKEFASMVEGRFDNILVLGIGGSALGGLAVTEALLKPYWNFLTPEQRNNLPRIFFLDNIDPDSINGLLDVLDLKKTLVNVITKSGDTAETMSQFMVIKDLMQKTLGDDYRKNIIATTDKKMGIRKALYPACIEIQPEVHESDTHRGYKVTDRNRQGRCRGERHILRKITGGAVQHPQYAGDDIHS